MSEQRTDTTASAETDHEDSGTMTTGDLANAMQRGPDDDAPEVGETEPGNEAEVAAAAGARPVADDEGDGDERDEHEPLLPPSDVDDLRRRWDAVQSTFVDEPREAVSKADAMVADLAQRLIVSFAAERERLEAQWTSGDDVSTEDLRLALRRYRSFFQRLLAA
jgi:hypothetical protein